MSNQHCICSLCHHSDECEDQCQGVQLLLLARDFIRTLRAAHLARDAIAAVDALQFHTDEKGVTSIASPDKWQVAAEGLDRARQALASLP